MANELDEVSGPVNAAGRDVRVIDEQLLVQVGAGSLIFEILLWVCGIIPGIIFLFKKIRARNHFFQLQQKLQAEASQIDNFEAERAIVLGNLVGLLKNSIQLDTEVMTKVAAYRGGVNPNRSGSPDADRNQMAQDLDMVSARLFPQIEAYPELKAHEAIANAMQQNYLLQRNITAQRSVYNDTVLQWNTEVYQWPTRMIVAARAGYKTRIPFIASAELKQEARKIFF